MILRIGGLINRNILQHISKKLLTAQGAEAVSLRIEIENTIH